MAGRTLFVSVILGSWGILPATPALASDHPARTPLVDEFNREIDSRIKAAGASPGDALTVLKSQSEEGNSSNPYTPNYTYNRSCWAADLDFTGCSVSHASIQQANHLYAPGTLITPQDIVGAAHTAGYPANDTLYFVDKANVVHSAKIAAGAQVSGTDIFVGHLSAPLPIAGPGAIKYYKLLPGNFASYFTPSSPNRCPLLVMYNFGHFAYTLDSAAGFPSLGRVVEQPSTEFLYTRCTEPNRSPYTTSIGSGSGSPGFVVIDGEPVIIGCLHTTGSFSFLADKIDTLNTTLSNLGSSYQITTIKIPSEYRAP